MAVVPFNPTPLEPRQMASVFAESYRRLFGRRLDAAAAPNLLAIIGLENGNGRAIIWHNWGNISGSPASGPAWAHPKPQPGHPYFFRAFDSHDSGSVAWWQLIGSRFPSVLRAALRNRPELMVRELYRLGYVGSPKGERNTEPDYRAGVVRLVRQYRRQGVFRGTSVETDFLPPLVGLFGASVAGYYALS